MELIDGVPPSVASIIKYLAMMARGYNNHLKWNEQAKFKADLMNVPHRWRRVDPDAFRTNCLNEGMRSEDADELTEWLKRRQAGRRLVPDKSYRDTVFNPPPEREEPYVNDRW